MQNSVVIALGTNLSNRFINLEDALRELEKFCDVELKSSIYSCPALLPKNAPESWDLDFYNCVILVKTQLNPQELLKETKKIEKKLCFNKRKKGTWAPRIIDVDIITFNDEIIKTKELNIPHHEMHKRDFVLVPMAQVLPSWKHPKLDKTISELITKIGKTDIKKTPYSL